MKYIFLKITALMVPVAILVVLAGTAFASDPKGYKIVDGTAIYFAVLPAEIIRGHKQGHTEATMHGGVPDGKHVHHIMIALFDADSFDRIIDAKIKATVTEVGLAGKTKTLEPFTVAGALTYGNYFAMPNKATYRVTVMIKRTDSAEVMQEVVFEYAHR